MHGNPGCVHTDALRTVAALHLGPVSLCHQPASSWHAFRDRDCACTQPPPGSTLAGRGAPHPSVAFLSGAGISRAHDSGVSSPQGPELGALARCRRPGLHRERRCVGRSVWWPLPSSCTLALNAARCHARSCWPRRVSRAGLGVAEELSLQLRVPVACPAGASAPRALTHDSL